MSDELRTKLPPVQELTALVQEAGRAILDIYRSGEWTVTAKADRSPVTQADLAANHILVPGLRRLTSDPIVSEESDPQNNDQSVNPGRSFWLIDPLDGTKDFVAKLNTFVICVARVQNDYPVFGLLHAPVTGESWWAAQGQGAFGPSGHRLYRKDRDPALVIAGSRSMKPERIAKLESLFPVKAVHRYGSALKFGKMAEGEVDLYPRFGPTSEWDTAAGQIIVEEAGCQVLDLSTKERLRYGKKNFANTGGFVAARNDIDIFPLLRMLEP